MGSEAASQSPEGVITKSFDFRRGLCPEIPRLVWAMGNTFTHNLRGKPRNEPGIHHATVIVVNNGITRDDVVFEWLMAVAVESGPTGSERSITTDSALAGTFVGAASAAGKSNWAPAIRAGRTRKDGFRMARIQGRDGISGQIKN